MTSITIITIVVVALLTAVIFGLTWLAYKSCLKSYNLEVSLGQHDESIVEEYSKTSKTKGGLVGLIMSYLVLLLLSALFVTGVVYKARGENFQIGNQTVLVIKSGSMSNYYNDELAEEYKDYNEYHFDVGDICVFRTLPQDENLVEGEVYGYKYKNIIITHRFIEAHDNFYEFRGDNNAISDPYYVKRENIVYHYTGHHLPGIGAFVLYAQSYFGIWSLVGIIGIMISSEVVYHQINKINKARYQYLDNPHPTTAEPLIDLELDEERFSKMIAFILDIWPEETIDSKKSAFEKAVEEIWPQLKEVEHGKK